MIRSMTGFGHARVEADDIAISAEISTLNHRHLDIALKMPSVLSSLENDARKLLQSRLERGRINVYLSFDGTLPGAGKLEFDEDLARQYIDIAREFAQAAGLKDDIDASTALRLSSPWTLKGPRPEDITDLWELVEKALTGAVDQLLEMRKVEGENLWNDLSARLQKIEEIRLDIETRAVIVVDEYREKLRERITSLLPTDSGIDEQRLLTEVAIFAEKADTSEEISRLESHIQQFETLGKQGENVGRRLDFLLQEMFREITTIGSKARDAGISHEVVEVKGQLEKMREQVQNVE